METWTSFNIATNFGRGWPLGVVRLLTSLQGSEMTFRILVYDSQKHVGLCTTLQRCLRTLLLGLPTLLIVMLALAAWTRLCCRACQVRGHALRTEHAFHERILFLIWKTRLLLLGPCISISVPACSECFFSQRSRHMHFTIIVCVKESAWPVLNMGSAASPFLENVFNIDADYWRYRPS